MFDFKEEGQRTEMTVRRISPEFGCPHTLNAENYDEEMAELSPVLQSDLVSLGQAAGIEDVESRIIFSSLEYGSKPSATRRLEDHSNNSFPVSSCNVKSVCLASDAPNSMNERFPSDNSDNNASSDGPSSDNCFDRGDLDDEREVIQFYADYLDYRGTQYMDYVVSFSRSYVEARSRTIHGDFHIHMETEDIVKIESQWSAQIQAGTINIYFIAKDAAQVEFDAVHNASAVSRVQELKFPAVDPNWYQKREAIESLDDKYKAVWNVLLDTGVDSSFREREDWMLTRSCFPKFEKPFGEVIYPKGDPDAVSISKRDADLLLPDTFVNDTIIDFYIKYLKTRQNVDERTKFHFFNSFFFRKLADMDKDPSSAFDGKAAFQRVRKWTKKVNLLEKDFIFIPVNYNLHWSLIVICYFGKVASYKGDDEPGRVPCILHMDSLRGTHSALKDLMQSYLWEEWKERQKGTCEDLYSKFSNLKFVPLEVPQQQNLYDCGLFLLHYVELFLEEVPTNFNIYKITQSLNFLQEDWFPPAEPSIKRTHIETLISGLLDSESEECLQSGRSGMHSPKDLNTNHGFDDGIQLTLKSGPPLGGSQESSLYEVGQGIEMTLLPTSSARSTQCTKTSGLVLKELFKQESTPESFTDVPWGALESRTSIFELKSPASLPEGEVIASECFPTTELVKQVFQHPDDVTQEAPTVPFQSENYRSEAVYQPTPGDADSMQVASDRDSGALLNTEGPVDINAPSDDSFVLKMLSDIGQKLKQLRDNVLPDEAEGACTSFASGDRLNVVECESPHQIPDSNDQDDPRLLTSNSHPGSGEQGNDDVGRERVSESAEEQHAAKRMRTGPTDDGEELRNHLLKDLNL
ncbi:probable ubiquitin-like-specific protease 2B isoform X1 [Salvia hispanica]|uniref:probable ubiquitin-like-specific protease 2B isoform X1 n=2 Tax=Salvia hispanica TaxID=49212 RepID=UPI0020097E66|nr:probable ubiquitin-like-specific protease 2B isoform X1 [Salvia hispanica]XP_047972794.1 probable ubiquitin-like-specific protease 2B isoform X1 [Salvia hispanica]